MEKIALVTGGTRGIGAAIAKKLKEDEETSIQVLKDLHRLIADLIGKDDEVLVKNLLEIKIDKSSIYSPSGGKILP